MSFPQGTDIGPYIIEHEIGRGGMGVVYLARDPRLDRYVAIKALPEHLAADPARLERFETEARSLAQLNHPNVAGIHGLEEKDGQKFLILEYVDGESLAERIDRRRFTVEEAVRSCIGIAAGIEAAHDAGVIHRDLKPDNIRITPEGEVKVLDFGLAKSSEAASTAERGDSLHEAPTLPTPQRHSPTMPGAIMGTAAYMSPEQAQGRRVDKRTDVWSFGVLLYECLTGAGPFGGATASESIGAVLHKEIDFERLPASTPLMVKHILAGCLERDKSRRYREIGNVRLELERAEAGSGMVEEAPRSGLARSSVIGLVLVISLLTAAAAWFGKPATPPIPPSVVNSEISLPEGTRMAHRCYPGLAISPDGQTIAFPYGDEPTVEKATVVIRRQGLMLRHLDRPEPIPVAGLPANAGAEPVFSPDGQWIACWTYDGIYKVPVSGGQSQKIAPALMSTGFSWGDDDSIVAGLTRGGLVRFPSNGGPVDTLTTIDPTTNELSHRLPHFIPGSDVLLFTVSRYGWQQSAPGAWSVWALRLSTRERVLVVEQASDARFVNGHVVFMREGSLFAIPFDPIGLEVTGAPRQVLEGVQHSVYFRSGEFETGAGMYAISASGTLVYCPGSVAPETRWSVVRVDREGNETTLDIKPRQYHTVRGSPDGKQLLLSSYYAPTSRIWVHDLESGISRRQRAEGTGYIAVWGPGPDRITFDRTMDDGRLRLFNRIVGAQAADDLEIEIPGDDRIWIGDWSRDSRILLGVNLDTRDLWDYTPEDGWAPVMETDGLYEGWPALSPDGRWLAYGSPESGRHEIFVRPFPGPGPTAQVSRHGGKRPVWSRDGSELFFRGRDAEDESSIMAAAVSDNMGQLKFGLPRPLFKNERYLAAGHIRSWDVLADGDFVFVKGLTDEQRHQTMLDLHANRFRVIQNWASTLAGDD